MKRHVIGVFIDLSKAFDTLDHKTLLHKLSNSGIRGNANKLIESYLSDRKQYSQLPIYRAFWGKEIMHGISVSTVNRHM